MSMRERIAVRLRRPAPLTWIAAAILAGGASSAALAASSSGDVVHACANGKTGALTLRLGRHCPAGSKSLSWSQSGQRGPTGLAGQSGVTGQAGLPGLRGTSGQDGVTRVTVRTATVTLSGSCVAILPDYICSGSGSGTVDCQAGERATDGGYDHSFGAANVVITASRPAPTSGAATAWSISGSYSEFSPSADATVPVTAYVICAGP